MYVSRWHALMPSLFNVLLHVRRLRTAPEHMPRAISNIQLRRQLNHPSDQPRSTPELSSPDSPSPSQLARYNKAKSNLLQTYFLAVEILIILKQDSHSNQHRIRRPPRQHKAVAELAAQDKHLKRLGVRLDVVGMWYGRLSW